MSKLLLPCLALTVLPAIAQSPADQNDLYRNIAALDAALFESYNHCELDKFRNFFVDDIEFYHDQGGVTLGNQSLTESVKKNICGKVRRELVASSLQVYPMKGYGAVEIGVHRFYHPGVQDPVGEARFIHLWQNKDGAWKITRVISYDHVALKK